MNPPPSFHCSLCGASVEFVAEKRGWHLWHCEACDHYAVLPTPSSEELRRVYSAEFGYGSGRETDLASTDSARAKHIDTMLTSLGVMRGTFLDVGCGDGRLLFHLRERGWTVAGTDYSPTYVAKCIRHGLDVRHGDLEDSGIERGRWVVAHMGDVIEHVIDPVTFLRTVAEFLVPDGVIIIRTPNAASGFSRLSARLAHATRTPWLASEAPWHLNDFTPVSLSLAIRRAGFDLMTCFTEGRRPFGYSIGGSGYLDAEKRRLKNLVGWPRRLALVGLAPKLLPVAAWTAAPFWFGRLADLYRGRRDYIVAYAKKRKP